MAKASDTWRVLAHRPIEKLAESLWRVEGDLEGMPLKRVMTVARRADGRLVIHNAIALGDEAMAEIDAWGKVGFIIVPNGYHRLDAAVFHARYPEASVLCPRGSRKKVSAVVPVSGTYEDFPPDEVVLLETLQGTNAAEGVMIVRDSVIDRRSADSGATTLVFNDAVFNMPHEPGLTGFVLKHVTASTGGPRVPRVVKLLVIKDKVAFRSHLERLAATPNLARIVVSHHETIDRMPADVLRQVATAL